MPRTKQLDDPVLDSASRRASGRARKPTAKIEALAGTKFYPSDSAKPNRNGSASLSPGPSANSSFSTPISPQSESAPYGTQENTSPSTISVQVDSPNADHTQSKQGPRSASSEDATSVEASRHSLRRQRKPTRRALEMTESASQTRRPRRTKPDADSRRASATPSDTGSTAELHSPSTDRRPTIGQENDGVSASIEAALVPAATSAKKTARKIEHPAVSARQNAQKPAPLSQQQTPDDIATPSKEFVEPITKKARRSMKGATPVGKSEVTTESGTAVSEPINGMEREIVETSQSGPTQRSRHSRGDSSLPEPSKHDSLLGSQPHDSLLGSQQQSRQEDSNIPTSPEAGRTSLRLKLSTRRPSKFPAQPEEQTPKRRSRSSAINYAELDLSALDTSGDESPAPARSISKRSLRLKQSLPEEIKPVEGSVSDLSSPVTRRLRLRQPVEPSLDSPAGKDVDSSESNGISGDAVEQSRDAKQTATSIPTAPSRKRRASPPEDERPRKSLKLKLSVPGLKAPSKLRFSINSQDLNNDFPPKHISAKPLSKAVGDAVEKKEQQSKADSTNYAPTPTGITPDLPYGPAPKLSRRAQAKAEAKALGKVRQATESANHDRLYDTTYGGASSHYAPSARLVRPAVDCGLFCLPEPSRILAFAKIAAESIESDDEENSDGGRQPELLNKWLQKGGQHCVCNEPPRARAADPGDELQERAQAEEPRRSTGQSEALQNEDIAAVVPNSTTLPLEIPPVNSIMSKSQGRRVSALYNVLTGSPSPNTSNNGSSVSTSRHQSVSVGSQKTPASPAPGSAAASMTPSAHAATEVQPSTGSYGERVRWDYQALERVRREAEVLGLVIPTDMPYAQIKTLLEERKTQRPSTMSERTHTPRDQHTYSRASQKPFNPFELDPPAALNTVQNGLTRPYADIEDDSEDRLLQIIGESFKATMKRNKSASTEPAAQSDSRHCSSVRSR